MTMSRPRYPLLASLPLLGIALGAATLVAQTPTPPVGAAPAGVIRPAQAPADRVTLSTDQVRALIAAHLPAVANGSSEDNTVTFVLATPVKLASAFRMSTVMVRSVPPAAPSAYTCVT